MLNDCLEGFLAQHVKRVNASKDLLSAYTDSLQMRDVLADLTGLADDFLIFSRMQARTFSLEVGSVMLLEVINQVTVVNEKLTTEMGRTFEVECLSHDLSAMLVFLVLSLFLAISNITSKYNHPKISIQLHNCPLKVMCDMTRLVQVLTNLISNGLQYSPFPCTLMRHRVTTLNPTALNSQVHTGRGHGEDSSGSGGQAPPIFFYNFSFLVWPRLPEPSDCVFLRP
jgi:light-regulated signal transduction histidine kinase (bacteriophytochrome)